MEDLLGLASKFVNQTSAHIYLTGKAGTGKTLLVYDIAKEIELNNERYPFLCTPILS